jgi:hypothetical protein
MLKYAWHEVATALSSKAGIVAQEPGPVAQGL